MRVSVLTPSHEAQDQDGSGVAVVVARAWHSLGVARHVVAAVALGCCVALTFTWPPASVAVGLTLGVLVLAAVVDVVEHRLPNALVAIAAVPVAVALLAATSSDLLRSALFGAALLGGPLLLTHLVSPAGMGFGDVKAGAVAGAALGLIDAQLALLALVLGLAAAAGWGLARRSRSVPFGPGLVAGALAALVVARIVGIEAVSW